MIAALRHALRRRQLAALERDLNWMERQACEEFTRRRRAIEALRGKVERGEAFLTASDIARAAEHSAKATLLETTR